MGEKKEIKKYSDFASFGKDRGIGLTQEKKVEQETPKSKGIIKLFNQEKGYGFIEKEDGKDIFFHISGLRKRINLQPEIEGKQVTFNIVMGEKGEKAIDIQFIDEHGQLPSPTQQTSVGLKNLKYCLPSDTRAALGKKLEEQQIDNFSLHLNKCAFFDAKEEKFEFYKKGKKDIFEIKPNFTQIDFTAINEHHKSAIKKLGLTIEPLIFSTDWRLIIGFGGESVYETSMTLHHIYGIPYIPGQAVKGVVRNSIITECFNNEEQALEDDGFRKIFGSQEEKGKVIFFDAFPTATPKIKPDITNVHYPDYYNDKKLPPADYQNPNPIPFLTVEKTEFEFLIGIKDKDNKPIETGELKGEPLKTAKGWLEEALKNYGIGAKTSVGYGFFQDLKVV